MQHLAQKKLATAAFPKDHPITHRDRLTKLLHILMALGINANLLLSLVMRPAEWGQSGDVWYLTHQWTGIALFIVLLTYWVWKLAGHLPQGWSHFFPWFSRSGRKALSYETHNFIRFRLSAIPAAGALSGAAHGLGLLAASGMAVSGVLQYLVFENYVQSRALYDVAQGAHELLGALMWVYLIGHSGMGILHQWLGHQSVTRIFSLNARDSIQQKTDRYENTTG